jgi:methyl-accepting chemotaxis protein
MKNLSLSLRISIAFGSTICCMVCLAGFSFYVMQQVLRSQTSHSQSFVPAKRLAAAFERDILNARIHFIYFVTIQKPGTIEKG